MGVYAGPELVSDGLILNLDIANRKSFIDSAGSQRSLIGISNWTLGSGGTTGFAANGLTSENERIAATDPFGVTTAIWETRASGNSEGDGGWEGSYFNIDRTKLYRSSVWVKRTSSTASGSFYHGLHTNGSGDVLNLADSTSNTNPYWEYRVTSGLTQNLWYLNVGHIYPTGTSRTTAHPDSGYWTTAGVKVGDNAGNIPSDAKFPSDATQAYQRVYHFYSGDNTTRLHLAYPRWDLIDGNEPTIAELLSNSQTQVKDTSGRGNHHFIPTYTIPNSDSPRKFTLDGSTHGFTRTSALNGVTNNCTVVMWYSTTDGQELWVRGNGNNGVYLSASSGNAYYHAGCGSPTNWVDLKQVTNPVTEGYRNGAYHMWEAKGVDFSGWTTFDWFLYPSGWQMSGNVSAILVYNRSLSAAESAQNFYALRGRYGI